MSRQQHILSFATKKGNFVKVKGRCLISSNNNISDRFKRMTLGQGSPAREKQDIEEDMGGSIRHHNRPYQLKNMEQPKKSTPSYKPIQFKL